MVETRRVEVDLAPVLVEMKAMEPRIVVRLTRLREDLAARDTEAARRDKATLRW